jgi:hypothetical protein
MTTLEMTQEQRVAADYSAAMDSVHLLQAGKPADWKGTDAEWADVITRNKEHLQIQIAKGAAYYGSNDLTPFTVAIAK